MRLIINGRHIGDLETTSKKEGLTVAEIDIPLRVRVEHDEQDNLTEATVIQSMSDMFRFSGDNGSWWAILDADNTWRVQEGTATIAQRVGLTMEAALEQAFTLSWADKKALA